MVSFRIKKGFVTVNSLVILVFASILIATIVLFVLYYAMSQSSDKQSNFSNQNISQAKLKSFTIEDSSYNLAPGEVKILPGGKEQGIMQQVVLLGRIKSAPVVDQASQKTTFRASFLKADGKEVIANVLLGSSNESSVSVYFPNGGVIGGTQTWEGKPVVEVVPFLNENDPVVLRLYYQDSPGEFLLGKECNTFCEEVISEIKDLYSSNKLLIENITGVKNDFVKDTLIGPVSGLIILPKL